MHFAWEAQMTPLCSTIHARNCFPLGATTYMIHTQRIIYPLEIRSMRDIVRNTSHLFLMCISGNPHTLAHPSRTSSFQTQTSQVFATSATLSLASPLTHCLDRWIIRSCPSLDEHLPSNVMPLVCGYRRSYLLRGLYQISVVYGDLLVRPGLDSVGGLSARQSQLLSRAPVRGKRRDANDINL